MLKYIITIVFALFLSYNAAEARSHYHFHRIQHSHHKHVVTNTSSCIETNNIMQPCAYQPDIFAGIRSISITLTKEKSVKHSSREQPHKQITYTKSTEIVGGRPSGCPSAFCGCSASLKVFGKIIPELNLAANWRKFPPATPAPGTVAYKAHHVFVIVAVNPDGTVVAHDGNSGGHLTRVHTVSLRGYHVVDPRA